MRRVMFGAAVGALGVSMPAFAGTIVMEIDTEFSGGSYPFGTAPWARATFTDKVGGGVHLLLECLLQDSSEFMAKAAGGVNQPKGWFFNLDAAMNPAHLTFTHTGGTAASGVFRMADKYKAGPDKFYDIVLQFGAGLQGGDTAEYTITKTGGGLSASSFDSVTANGGFHTAVHVQGIDTGAGSGWMAGGMSEPEQVVPLPSAGAMALAGIGLLPRRRRAIG